LLGDDTKNIDSEIGVVPVRNGESRILSVRVQENVGPHEPAPWLPIEPRRKQRREREFLAKRKRDVYRIISGDTGLTVGYRRTGNGKLGIGSAHTGHGRKE
jgi:hypothetical protein